MRIIFHQALDDVDDFATYPRFVSHWHQVGLPGTQGLNKISDKQVSAIKSPKMTSIRLIWQSTGIRRFMIYFSCFWFHFLRGGSVRLLFSISIFIDFLYGCLVME